MLAHYAYLLVFFSAGLFFWWRALVGFDTAPLTELATSAVLGALCWLQFTSLALAHRRQARQEPRS